MLRKFWLGALRFKTQNAAQFLRQPSPDVRTYTRLFITGTGIQYTVLALQTESDTTLEQLFKEKFERA